MIVMPMPAGPTNQRRGAIEQFQRREGERRSLANAGRAQ
jgi:hypothetical protein